MTETVDTERAAEILTAVCLAMEEAKGRLNELDSAVGDGDSGISLSYGFRAVREGLAEHPQDVGKTLMQAGVRFADAAGATIGALLSTAFLRAGKEVQGRSEVGLPELARMVAAAEKGIRERGKAQPGNKTMLDALAPAAAALETAAGEGVSLEEALARAVAAAEQGALATANMVAGFGRSRWLGERTLGHQDPGATAVYLILRSAAEALARPEG